jgi:hypothetical protein
LLLEDLSSGRFGDVATGCSAKEAELVVDNLAAFHAQWWNSPRLSDFDWLPRYGDTSSQMEKLRDRRGTFLEQFGDCVPRQVQEMTNNLGPQHVRLLETLLGPPETLLHVVLYDWQGVSKGLSAVDLALFLTSASTGQQASHDARLLTRYHDGLVRHGVDKYPFDRFQRDYRVALLRRWIGTVNGLATSYAKSWTGRQAALARQSVVRWGPVLINHRLPEFVFSHA